MMDAILLQALLMLILMTLTQGHSGSAKAKNQHCMRLATKEAITWISIKLARLCTTICHLYVTLLNPDFASLYGLTILFFSSLLCGGAVISRLDIICDFLNGTKSVTERIDDVLIVCIRIDRCYIKFYLQTSSYCFFSFLSIRLFVCTSAPS